MKLATSFLLYWLPKFSSGSIKTYKDLCRSLKDLPYDELPYEVSLHLRAFKKLNKQRRMRLLRSILSKKLSDDCLKLLFDARYSGLIKLSDRDYRNYAAEELRMLGYLRKTHALSLPFCGVVIYYVLTPRGWDL